MYVSKVDTGLHAFTSAGSFALPTFAARRSWLIYATRAVITLLAHGALRDARLDTPPSPFTLSFVGIYKSDRKYPVVRQG